MGKFPYRLFYFLQYRIRILRYLRYEGKAGHRGYCRHLSDTLPHVQSPDRSLRVLCRRIYADPDTTSSPLLSDPARSCGFPVTSSRSSRWLPPMISPTPGTSKSIAATVFAVVIQTHIKRLDFLRIIDYKYRLFENLLCQIAFMLCLQITCPTQRDIQTSAPHLLQKLNGFGVGHSCRIIVIGQNIMQTAPADALSTKLLKNSSSSRAVFQYMVNDIFYHILMQAACHRSNRQMPFRVQSSRIPPHVCVVLEFSARKVGPKV